MSWIRTREVPVAQESRRWPSTMPAEFGRAHVLGKFFYLGDEKFWARGVTYGAFRPDEDGKEYHNLELIERDFAQMAAHGFTAVRIPHTMPPTSLLDIALRQGLRVMVGLSAEQYVGYLIDRDHAPDLERLVRDKVRACTAHPALLCYAIGNEIPASTVRWLGRRKVEQYLHRLYDVIKAVDPEGLVTYVNYPSTEYLELPFLDLVCFNVYLEAEESFTAYLARLQNIAGERPLVMSEIGLDSLRNGEAAQARLLDWQVRATFSAGCAGAFIFSWTDEWHRGGAEVNDWRFGLTDRHRRAKPALRAVTEAMAELPLPKQSSWLKISVVVCSYNGSRTIHDCLDALLRLDYPDFEVIVIDDGSTDGTAAIARAYGFRVISTENRGLSSARNTGLAAATGDVVAYIDDDAYPDPDWLTFIAGTLTTTAHVGVGGPNLPPAGDGPVAECVANAPGGPMHVLLSDGVAEHIPGCNMAFWKRALEAIGGFDSQFRAAGDDVDVCWRMQERGWSIAFSPAAVVWHHRRNSFRAYWKQQEGYGKAEALLERKWPQKYNGAGHVTWGGRVYGRGLTRLLGRAGRIYHGVWGAAPFQSLYQPATGLFSLLPLMPEWSLLVLGLAALAALGAAWTPLSLARPLLALAIGASVAQAALSAARASFPPSYSGAAEVKLRSLTALLYLLQPIARLVGRVGSGLTPWRPRGAAMFRWPWPGSLAIWSECWREDAARLQRLEAAVRIPGAPVRRGGDFDRWDLEVCGGMLGAARLLMAVEQHPVGAQLVRIRWWPTCPAWGVLSILLLGSLAVAAFLDRAGGVSTILGLGALSLACAIYRECGRATAAFHFAIEHGAVEAVDTTGRGV